MVQENEKKHKDNETLVVGLGASAGGLDALKLFFQSLPDRPGMAFIVVLHLAPDHKSNLSDLLQNETDLQVEKVSGRTEIKEGHVYVIPPNQLLSVENNHLELNEPQKKHGLATIDLLFRTLAEKKKRNAAGVILSGTGSDGTTGIKAIKEHGGISIAQDPDEAQHAGMPKSAIDTGVVDKVLGVKDIAEELVAYKKTLPDIRIHEQADKIADEPETEKILSDIFDRIRSRVDHDFSNYRRSSVLRRIDRRMRVNRVKSLSEYLSYIDRYPDELDELYKDLLISVTSFFRDKEAFEALEEQVIPKLFEDKKEDDQLRIWVPGCATGEEAYSLGILLLEYASKHAPGTNIQIFASDVDKDALDKARAGRYPKSIKEDLSERRLNHFFNEDEDAYIIKQELRDILLFASHDLLRNPPFSKLNLISCRNLFIYLNRELQSEVFNLFHYALRPEGWLFLGKSDSRAGAENLFTSVDKEFRIYRQKPNHHSRMPLPDMPLLYKTNQIPKYENSPRKYQDNLEKMHWSILAGLYAPESVIIDEDHQVIHSTDGIKKYLEYGGGKPSQDILDMVKPDIRQGLRTILFQLENKESLPGHKKVEISQEEAPKLEIIARRFSESDFPQGFIHIVFKELPESTEVGIIFVDNEQCVQRYTSTSTKIFNLIDSDKGRPLDHITHSLEYDELVDDVKQVLDNLEKVKKVVSSTDDRWFIMRLRPYRSTENKIEGVVITFTEFTELREAQEKLKTQSYQKSLATLGVYALEQSNLQTVLKRAIDIGCINLDLDCAVIYALNAEDNTFGISAQAGCAKEGDAVAVDEQWDAGFAFRNTEKPTIVANYKEEKRFSISPYLVDEDIVSSVHLVARGSNETYGMFGFYSYKERSFTDHELNFLQSIANIVGMTIQQKTARDNLRQETERSRRYQKEILNNSVVERWELGGYLHDNLGQMLASAKIILADIKNKLSNGENNLTGEITHVNKIIDDSIEGIRDLTHDIIPVDIEKEGVEHAFRFLMRYTQKLYDINCTLQSDHALDEVKDRKLATHLYHIVQEAIKNAAVHGKAKNIVVSIKKSDEALVLKIQDDGDGFSDSLKKGGNNNGKGMRIMKHRMELLGGSFSIEKKVDDGDKTGTVITCTVPSEHLS